MEAGPGVVGGEEPDDAPVHGLGVRLAELVGTVLALAAAAGLAMVSMRLAAAVAVGGHLLVRLISRGMRGRWAWGWPPLRQPGAEIAPLVIVLAVSLVPP